MILPTPVKATCIIQAAKAEKVPVPIILGLLATEGGKIGTASKNTNGSDDLGPMQVNDYVWVPVVARNIFKNNYTKAYLNLRYNGCFNIAVGTFIYRLYLNEADGNYGKAIGWYNSHDPYYANQYRQRFKYNFTRIFEKYLKK